MEDDPLAALRPELLKTITPHLLQEKKQSTVDGAPPMPQTDGSGSPVGVRSENNGPEFISPPAWGKRNRDYCSGTFSRAVSSFSEGDIREYRTRQGDPSRRAMAQRE